MHAENCLLSPLWCANHLRQKKHLPSSKINFISCFQYINNVQEFHSWTDRKCTKCPIKGKMKCSDLQVSDKTVMGLESYQWHPHFHKEWINVPSTPSPERSTLTVCTNLTLSALHFVLFFWVFFFSSFTFSHQLPRFATIQTSTSLSRTNILCTYYFSCPVKFPKGFSSLNGLTLYHQPVTAQVALVTKKQFCASTQICQPT